jgi:hypothetical protein
MRKGTRMSCLFHLHTGYREIGPGPLRSLRCLIHAGVLLLQLVQANTVWLSLFALGNVRSHGVGISGHETSVGLV